MQQTNNAVEVTKNATTQSPNRFVTSGISLVFVQPPTPMSTVWEAEEADIRKSSKKLSLLRLRPSYVTS